MIKNKIQLNNGFMVGLSVIIVTVILVLTLSISLIVLRNINKISTPTNSIIAYNIADSALRCLDSINNNVGTTTSTSTGYFRSIIPIATTTGGVVTISFDNTSSYTTNSIKCLGDPIFSDVKIKDALGIIATTTVLSTTTISDDVPNAYIGGGRIQKLIYYQTGIDNITIPQSCVYIEVYSTTTSSTLTASSTLKKLFNATGRVPCEGNNVSRTISLEKIEANE
ncbi:MAG: hypothetical protein QM532_02975 [Cyanobium sp. MAG06]|nr:hypothetical protein [Cyanobium sp. MAG06]